MSFQEVLFPEGISYGASGGPGWSTFVGRSEGGSEYRTSLWSFPKLTYDVSYGLRGFADLTQVRDFYYSMRGSLHGFRFKDFTDFSSAAGDRDASQGATDYAFGDQTIGTGDGTKKDFQLVKIYSTGLDTITRNIRKPIAGKVKVGVNGVETTAFTVDTTTGIVSITTAPPLGQVVTAGFEFHVPVRFGDVADESFRMTMDAFDTGSIQSIDLVEDWAADEVSEIFYHGGAKDHGTITADVAITIEQGRVHVAQVSGAGLSLVIPDPSLMPIGGPVFVIHNLDTTDTLGIKISGAGSAFVQIPTSSAMQVWIGYDALGAIAYFAL